MTSVILDYINSMQHGVIAIVGGGKQFKSGTMYSLFEYCPKLMERPKAFMKFPSVNTLFPHSLKAYPVEEFDDVEPGSICVIEDANRLFPSRSSSSDTILQEFIGVVSHKDILVILTVQNTSDTDKAFFRAQDTVFIHKRMNPVGIGYERPELQANCQLANIVIDRIARSENVNPLYVSYVPRWANRSLVLDKPPGWYGYAQSHALRNVRIKRSKDVKA